MEDREYEELGITNHAQEIWAMYQAGIAYQSATGMSSEFPRYVDYYQGKQWGAVEDGTEGMPRMVFNIIANICDIKKANIQSIPCRIVFKSENNKPLAEKLTRYAAYWEKESRYADIEDNAMDDGTQLGTYVYHFYWDADAVGKDGKKHGSTRVELINPLNVFVQNPLEEDINNQKWVIISSRNDVEAVREMADDGIDTSMIMTDNNENNPYGTQEQKDSDLCTVLTRYFKQDGEVYCERCTQSMMVNEAFPITPDFGEFDKADGEDVANTTLTDNPKEKKNVKATLYPVVIGSYKRKRDSIFGQGEVETLIPNQVPINKIASLQAYNSMLCGWNKYLVAPDALRDQEITDEVGQVLTDYSKGGNGIKQMPSQVFNGASMQLLSQIMSDTRSLAGANEVLNGEVLKSGMSGAAIAQLQAQASLPIENSMHRKWRVKEQAFRVWLQFERLNHIEDTEFTYEEGIGEDKKTKTDTFNGSEIGDVPFDIVAVASGGTRSSTAGDIAFLDNLVQLQVLNGMEYIKAYPDDAIENKEQILAIVKERENRKVEELEAKLAEYDNQMANATRTIEQLMQVVNNIMPTIRENNQLKADIAELQGEYTGKIEQANAAITQANQVAKAVSADAMVMAETLQANGLIDQN